MNNLIIGQHSLPWRQVETEDGPVAVPRYVSKSGNYWQVRITRQDEPTLIESFSHHCNRRALDMAIERLHDVLPKYTPHDCLRNRLSRYYYVHEYFRRGLMEIRVNARICSYRSKVRSMSFYAGTENTMTQDRLNHCIARAIGTRMWAGEMIRECGRSVLLHEPLPTHVEDYA